MRWTPPYGIKYGSNFQPFVNKRDVKDRNDEDLTQEPEMIKAFRDTWELGIHSYLTYLRDRLLLARELLHESGSVFVQISEENLHHVRELMDEIFGTNNFCQIITFRKKLMPLGATLVEGMEDLKSRHASNESFWLMGQPDVEIQKTGEDQYRVEVHGFDYFDAKTGELISGGKNNIAMWELDTDYDDRSLFPRQVFFPLAGAKDGWRKLKKDIRTELDEDLLGRYHSTVSLPFEAGDNRRIAIKIIDDRGIESLKILNLD